MRAFEVRLRGGGGEKKPLGARENHSARARAHQQDSKRASATWNVRAARWPAGAVVVVAAAAATHGRRKRNYKRSHRSLLLCVLRHGMLTSPGSRGSKYFCRARSAGSSQTRSSLVGAVPPVAPISRRSSRGFFLGAGEKILSARCRAL